jgi:hypothetical protein
MVYGRRCCFVDRQQRFEQGLEQLEVEGVGAVGFGVGRIVVDFEEEAVDALRRRRRETAAE